MCLSLNNSVKSGEAQVVPLNGSDPLFGPLISGPKAPRTFVDWHATIMLDR